MILAVCDHLQCQHANGNSVWLEAHLKEQIFIRVDAAADCWLLDALPGCQYGIKLPSLAANVFAELTPLAAHLVCFCIHSLPLLPQLL